MTRFILKQNAYEMTKEQVERELIGVVPEAIRLYYVEINGKKFPLKQVISYVLKLGKVEFTTMDAANIVRRLGFKIKQMT
jgi:5-methylcytosine-specific restriction protein B